MAEWCSEHGWRCLPYDAITGSEDQALVLLGASDMNEWTYEYVSRARNELVVVTTRHDEDDGDLDSTDDLQSAVDHRSQSTTTPSDLPRMYHVCTEENCRFVGKELLVKVEMGRRREGGGPEEEEMIKRRRRRRIVTGKDLGPRLNPFEVDVRDYRHVDSGGGRGVGGES